MEKPAHIKDLIQTTRIDDCKILTIPKIKDPRGNIAVIEKEILPFESKRVYYLYDVPSDAVRGGHAHKELKQFIIALSGSFTVLLHDGKEQKEISLNKPDKGLLLVPGIWRKLEDFSSGSVCLVLASATFDEEDYIRDFTDFLSYKK
ncbi:FdtA/QdtA family cupin domain-containing protein [Aquimarina sp. ERC-38]|uniref:sugar 3,4-ketoisomerase n=1 Tax=Aquimarina sp. ERC-38 TaxID=2949996 RepID=UPI002246CA7F|nr:FdtA/QdtA family cupin domain-containing protein [Aquimarina sp. ERC-38]UZO80826.1 FdtA/QdtA family cupin domain-containing protein [Aquimarina sp. ERC-38]